MPCPTGPTSLLSWSRSWGLVQQHDAVIGLARVGSVEDSATRWQPLLGRIGTIDLGRTPADVRGDLEAVRVFAGTGAGAGQLDDELERRAGSWSTPSPVTCSPRPLVAVAIGAPPPGGDLSWCRRTTRDSGPTVN